MNTTKTHDSARTHVQVWSKGFGGRTYEIISFKVLRHFIICDYPIHVFVQCRECLCTLTSSIDKLLRSFIFFFLNVRRAPPPSPSLPLNITQPLMTAISNQDISAADLLYILKIPFFICTNSENIFFFIITSVVVLFFWTLKGWSFVILYILNWPGVLSKFYSNP